eukprot:355368-Chlamydomonas_euryale.AAC.23
MDTGARRVAVQRVGNSDAACAGVLTSRHPINTAACEHGIVNHSRALRNPCKEAVVAHVAALYTMPCRINTWTWTRMDWWVDWMHGCTGRHT